MNVFSLHHLQKDKQHKQRHSLCEARSEKTREFQSQLLHYFLKSDNKAIIIIQWYFYYNHRVRYHCNQEIMLAMLQLKWAGKKRDQPNLKEKKREPKLIRRYTIEIMLLPHIKGLARFLRLPVLSPLNKREMMAACRNSVIGWSYFPAYCKYLGDPKWYSASLEQSAFGTIKVNK